jgi:hypothetical protein
VQQSGTLVWLNDRQFLSDLGAQVEVEEARLRATVQTFYAKGLITRTQAETTRPKLSIVVFDDRSLYQLHLPPLPPLPVADSRTSFRIGQER